MTESLEHKFSPSPFSLSADEVIAHLNSSSHGLSHSEALARLQHWGRNCLPSSPAPSVMRVFLHQFLSPLIYVLIFAALISLFIQEWSDAIFIAIVLFVNAIIGTAQEYSAQKAASALHKMTSTQCRVLREGDSYEIDAEELVPGDIILLESGDRVPADCRLITSHDLEIDESLLTGESIPVLKNSSILVKVDSSPADRLNMAHAGTMINRGRSRCIVTSTAMNTELGMIASAILNKPTAKAPLLVRMETFTRWVALTVLVIALFMAVIAWAQGMPTSVIFLLVVALAVSAIPEGLPVALTVALAISMRRMAKRNVIVRKLIAVEALGSCTFIATDKTGTLTINQLTARKIITPDGNEWSITGQSLKPTGQVLTADNDVVSNEERMLKEICYSAILPNEGFLGRRNNEWVSHGDAVDVALLMMAHKAGYVRTEISDAMPSVDFIPFESERLFCASLHRRGHKHYAFVKGAIEQLLPMCSHMFTMQGQTSIDSNMLEKKAHKLALAGYRVLALVSGEIKLTEGEVFSEEHLSNLTFVGLIGMIDPLRPEAKSAITRCRDAGIEVAMVTGDHPATAMAIAKELGLVSEAGQIVTGMELKRVVDEDELDALTRHTRVYARVEPRQKLDIIHSLQRNGHFVAVSGDGANDAPALLAAEVGVAMGKNGTDVARESAALILTDDNFSSIIAGVEEGRVAYANVRKVIFLLVSTGAAELVLFTLALLTGLPLPLLAVQLLWLNLVTNGIQDIALAFEPAEGGELKKPPRSPNEPIFDRLMIERVINAAIIIGVTAFLLFNSLINAGFTVDEARNSTLLLMVLFENMHVLNCRSEKRSIFNHTPLSNPLLLFGTLAAQAIHIGAMYTPWLSDVLNIKPVSFEHWLQLLAMSLVILLAMEAHKFFRNRHLLV
ncbi:MAG: HAD-IC family P-type ATPase [Sulfuriflexus sp.]|nr:HAD-IC family P-type ATPase [Sulfuriflexus sp.]